MTLAVRVFDVRDGVPRFGPDPAPRWYVLALADGSPIARFEMPALEEGVSSRLLEAALVRRTDPEIARRALIASLRTRLGPPAAPVVIPHRSCSVVVCTHRRPTHLPSLLAALAALDPPPEQIVVVDNDPGEEACRAQVEAIGARYVREDRRGLDNARNTGLRECDGEVVVFTDDDCVPSKRWLRQLDAAFAEPGVVAVTGPAFPFSLDTPAKVRMEAQASLERGLRRTTFDWSTINPCHAGAIGVGANMAFRRDCLQSLGEYPFPPELDAGTPTESGGDTYVVARLLARGHRVLYEPDMFVFHQHRADGRALHRAVRGYGIGVSAALSKLLVEDHETSALVAWTWLLKQYTRAQGRRLLGRGDAVSTRIAWDYLQGGLLGLPRWRRSLAHQRALGMPVPTRAGAGISPASTDRAARRRPSESGSGPEVSIIIPTDGKRHDALTRCLESIERQDTNASFEVIVVDDEQEPSLTMSMVPAGLETHLISSGGAGAAAARNAGAAAARARLLLFLDDDMVAAPGLVAAHLARHDSTPRVVVGPYPARPRRRTLMAVAAARWWDDTFSAMEQAISHGFSSALTGNLSVPAVTFADLGGFHESFGLYRREDWEWGIRVREAGVAIEFEPLAIAHHEYTLDSRRRLAAARREGHGDWLLTQRFPQAVGALPIGEHAELSWSQPLRAASIVLAPRAPVRWFAEALLEVTERMRLRTAWSKLFGRLNTAAYVQGLHEAGGSLLGSTATSLMDVALDGTKHIAAPGVVAPTLRLTISGNEVSRVAPQTGIWTPTLADQIADSLAWPQLGELAVAKGWIGSRAEALKSLDGVEVVLDAGDRLALGPLAKAGAQISVVAPTTGLRDRIAAAARRNGPALVAFPIAGVAAERAWLDETLVAFDSRRVGVLVGGALGKGTPLAALYLHDSQTTSDPPPQDAPTPCFVIIRRELADPVASRIADSEDPIAVLAQILSICTDLGSLAARRDAHGLSGRLPDGEDAARAWLTLVVSDILPGRKSRRGDQRPGSATPRAAGVLAWECFKAATGSQHSRRLLRGGVGGGFGALAAARLRLARARCTGPAGTEADRDHRLPVASQSTRPRD